LKNGGRSLFVNRATQQMGQAEGTLSLLFFSSTIDRRETVMLNLKRTTLAVAFASSAALSLLAMPGADAGPRSDDFWSQLNNTDGGADYSANFVDGPKVSPTPEQAAQLSDFEAQRQLTDGAGDYS
jgi:hypothetical protein